jgi:hypothetical protein
LAGGRSGVAAAPAAARAGAARGARWRSRAAPPQHERRGGGFPARCWRPVAGSVPGDLDERLLQCNLPGLQRGWPCARCAGEFPNGLRIAGLTGWSWGMSVKLAWLWRWRVRHPAWLMIIWNTPASAIPCSLATVAQEAPEAARAAEPARGLSLVGRSQRPVRPAAARQGSRPPPAGWASRWRGPSWWRRVPA